MMESGDSATLPMGGGVGGVRESGHQTALMRPNSLLGPEREPIDFTVNLLGAPPEVEQLVEHIKSVAEQFLYHWKTFPIGMYKNKIIIAFHV